MASRLALRLLRRTTAVSSSSSLTHRSLYTPSIFSPLSLTQPHPLQSVTLLRLLSTSPRRGPTRPKPIDIGARARQLQNRRLWTYALTFSCIAGFVVIVLNSFQDQLVFYVTPTEALEKYAANPTKNKFRLGGLVLEGSVVHPTSSPELEFVVSDLVTDILVRYKGSLPDLFREGHSVVVEGFVKPFTEQLRRDDVSEKSVSGKARTVECYFSATEVLAKHDEKYMPGEVAAAIEKNKKKLEEEARASGEIGAPAVEANAATEEGAKTS